VTFDQLDMFEQERDAALAAVAANTDAGWAAWRVLVRYLQTHREFFVDDFWTDTGLDQPREARALGPLVLRASRENLMVKSGRSRPSVRSHLSEKPVWLSLICDPFDSDAA
jgi:hypothetical protein